MDSCNNSSTSAPRRPILALARYRVMAGHRDRSQSLVTLAENCRQAANLAKALSAKIAAAPNGITSVCVEEWVGTRTEGEWKRVSLSRGGFSERFETGDLHNGKPRNPSLPKTGDEVQCVLLGDKTRKGGWKAKLLKRGMEGPITNTADVPKSARPGQAVVLRLGTISHDGKRIQFHWQQADNVQSR